MHTGSCLCGGIRFRIHGELAPIQICHCTQCRKAQGGPFATNIPIAASALEWISGKDLIKCHRASPDKGRYFCGACGSPIYSQRDATPDVLRIRAGTIDEPVHTKPAFHIFAGSQCSWWGIQDDLPQYAGLAPDLPPKD